MISKFTKIIMEGMAFMSGQEFDATANDKSLKLFSVVQCFYFDCKSIVIKLYDK